MPAALSYPGVYIEEVPSGVRTIVGVATSIAAFIGRAKRGPTNKPIVINSYADFERIFGGLWDQSSLGYAVRDFYLNGGSQAIIVRLFSPQAADMAAHDKAKSAAETAAKNAAKAAEDQSKVDGSTIDSVLNAINTSAATAGNLGEGATQVEKDAAALGAQGVAKAATEAKTTGKLAPAPSTLAVAVAVAGEAAKNGATPATVTAVDAVVKAATDEAPKSGATLLSVLTAVSTAVAAAPNQPAALVAAVDSVLKAAADASTSEITVTKETIVYLANQSIGHAAEVAADETVPVNGIAQLVVNGLTLAAASEGTWGNKLRVRVDADISEKFAEDLNLQKSDLFNLTVFNTATNEMEVFRNVGFDNGPRLLKDVLRDQSNLIRVKDTGGRKPTPHRSQDPTNPDDSDIWRGKNADQLSTKAALGGDGSVLKSGDFILNTRATKSGLYALLDADLFNLLCIPPHSSGTDIGTDLIDAAISFCEERRAMLLVDPPSSWTSKGSVTQDAGAGNTIFKTQAHRNAAVFFPRLTQPDPLRDGQTADFVPCGAVAGIFARTDATRGVWKAPAGLDATLVGVPQLSVTLNDLDNGELNKLGVNCLRTMPAAGRVIWGSRTRVGDDRLASEWKYIPVRRTALFIEESLYRGTQWVVFEPNDEPLWSQIRLNVGAFMHNLFRQGAFQGATPREAYFVKCDKETTTQNDINLGIVNILVGFAPLKPAEFVVIKLQQIAGNIET